MGKEVTHIREFTKGDDSPFTLSKDVIHVHCDDKSVYRFERVAERSAYGLARRFVMGKGWSPSRGRLPEAVVEALNEQLGEKGWQK